MLLLQLLENSEGQTVLSEAQRRSGSSLDSSGWGFYRELGLSRLGKISICRPFPPSLPPSDHSTSNKVCEVLGTRKNRSNSGLVSVLKESIAQLNISPHLQSPKRGKGRQAWGGGLCTCSARSKQGEVRERISRGLL